MRQCQKPLWAFIHILAIFSVLTCLATGLRIAILDHPYLLKFSGLLPQGEMHTAHILAASCFSLCVASYLLLRAIGRMYVLAKVKTRNTSIRFHITLTRILYVISMGVMLSGWLLFASSDVLPQSTILFVHYVCALLFLVYIVLHGGAWFVEFGYRMFIRMLKPFKRIKHIYAWACGLLVLMPLIWVLILSLAHHTLEVEQIEQSLYVQIDGIDSETVWGEAKPLTVHTHGGANFDDGATPVTIRALQNGAELFMLIEWQDPSESLMHLPLVKTNSGWQIQQNGFHEFNETQYYEDKFAVILSENCNYGAAGTAHLGPKPLKDKPEHWSGQGYHYSKGEVVDLWHWKALRTNHMRLMDDNYISEPDIVRLGSRRYTAGYKTDAKESGAYKMNWRWYSKGTVVPKRLPLDPEWVAPYQPGEDIKKAELPGILPWFDGTPYTKEKDELPIGTVMPSILYNSNQFEGDRAHVRAYGTWREGKWTLELFRRLDTQSENDVKIEDGVCIWVAAFDQSQIAHTRHVRPIKLSFSL